MNTFEQELREILRPVAELGNLDVGDELEGAIPEIIELVDREIRKTNISQVENWRDWISTNEELDWLVKEMDEAIASLKDETLTDANGVYLDGRSLRIIGLDK